MLTSSLVTPNALKLQLPGKKSGKSTSTAQTDNIRVDRRGTYYFNNNRISLSGLDKQLKTLKDRKKSAAIVIRTSSAAPVDNVVAVMDLAWKHQIDAVIDETD